MKNYVLAISLLGIWGVGAAISNAWPKQETKIRIHSRNQYGAVMPFITPLKDSRANS